MVFVHIIFAFNIVHENVLRQKKHMMRRKVRMFDLILSLCFVTYNEVMIVGVGETGKYTTYVYEVYSQFPPNELQGESGD